MRWAIVIGVDEYGDDELRLTGAVADALRFRDWVSPTRAAASRRPNLRLLRGRPGAHQGQHRHRDQRGRCRRGRRRAPSGSTSTSPATGSRRASPAATRARWSRRASTRSTPTTRSPSARSPSTSRRRRSRTSSSSSTPAATSRGTSREFEIGRWPVPRRRDPGAPPVQQFILYATSPGRTAAEVGFPGEAEGAFSGVLMEGLAGTEQAKAWSWERNCYEVRWERLASYVHDEHG